MCGALYGQLRHYWHHGGSGSGSTDTQPCAGDNEVVITVGHDNYPMETGWTVTDDSSGAVVATQQEKSFATEGGNSVHTIYLAEGSYTLKMTGSYGDGVGYQEGNG
jgi:hypothetical protein